MHSDLIHIEKSSLMLNLPDFEVGQTVKIHQRFMDGEKERFQIFEGLIIKMEHGKGVNGTITVRKMIDGIGVERVIAIHSPSIVKVDLLKKAKVRRNDLGYLRGRGERASRLKTVLIAKSFEPKRQGAAMAEVAPTVEEVKA